MWTVGDIEMAYMEDKYSYKLGEPGKPHDMRSSDSEEEAILRASLLQRGDGAFVLRSDKTWSFGIVAQKVLGKTPQIDFIVDAKGSMKSLLLKRWASSIQLFQHSSKSTSDVFIRHLSLCLEVAGKSKTEAESSRHLNAVISSLPSKVRSLKEEDMLDERPQTFNQSCCSLLKDGSDYGAAAIIHEQDRPPLSEITVCKRVQNKGRASSSDMSSDSAATMSGDNRDTNRGAISSQKGEPTRECWNNQKETKVHSDYRSYQQTKYEQSKPRRTPQKIAPVVKVIENRCNVQTSIRISIKFAQKTMFQSLFEETMHKTS